MKKIREFYYRWKALKGLRKKYYRDMAINHHLKDWITDCIIDRKQEGRRKELKQLEAELNEQELFLNWLRQRSVFKK